MVGLQELVGSMRDKDLTYLNREEPCLEHRSIQGTSCSPGERRMMLSMSVLAARRVGVGTYLHRDCTTSPRLMNDKCSQAVNKQRILSPGFDVSKEAEKLLCDLPDR